MQCCCSLSVLSKLAEEAIEAINKSRIVASWVDGRDTGRQARVNCVLQHVLEQCTARLAHRREKELPNAGPRQHVTDKVASVSAGKTAIAKWLTFTCSEEIVVNVREVSEPVRAGFKTDIFRLFFFGSI